MLSRGIYETPRLFKIAPDQHALGGLFSKPLVKFLKDVRSLAELSPITTSTVNRFEGGQKSILPKICVHWIFDTILAYQGNTLTYQNFSFLILDTAFEIRYVRNLSGSCFLILQDYSFLVLSEFFCPKLVGPKSNFRYYLARNVTLRKSWYLT